MVGFGMNAFLQMGTVYIVSVLVLVVLFVEIQFNFDTK